MCQKVAFRNRQTSENAQEMGAEASQIRILHKILMRNSYVPASVYFCPGCLLKSLILLGLHIFVRVAC